MQAKATKMHRPFLPENRQGLAIDIIVIVINLLLFPLFTSRLGEVFNQSFANDPAAFSVLAQLMMFALAGRLLGLYLKRFPLQSRLSRSEDGKFPLMFFVFSVPLLVLTSAFVVVLVQNVVADFGMIETYGAGVPKGSLATTLIGVGAMTALIAGEVFLLWRLSKPLTEIERERRDRGVWMYTAIGEYAADFGLFVYVMIWQVFYFQTANVLTTLPDGSPVPADMKAVSIFFLAVCFVLFYLAPRAVFLIEDRKYLGTWLFILLVFLSSIVRIW